MRHLSGAVVLTLVACSGEGGPDAPAAPAAEPVVRVPPGVTETARGAAEAAACTGCHAAEVAAYFRDHAMAASVGPVGTPARGSVVHPESGRSYELSREGSEHWFTTVEPDGGRRRQKVVGRIGAGRFGNSWVTAEADVVDGSLTDRLFFAPLETMSGRLVLAPFEESEPAAGADMALTDGCLSCHVDQPLRDLPGASRGEPPVERIIFPANALGSDALDHLEGIGCRGCHGPTDRHLAVVVGDEVALDEGVVRLAALPAVTQLDVCARCHLQGDYRWELDGAGELGPQTAPMPARLPVTVVGAPDDDFRFVGQLERLALSACFTGSPTMTCTTCHEAHRGVAAQGVPAFDARCVECHQEIGCDRPADLDVETVTGEPQRSDQGCVDCHVRRSQPYDLTHVRSADHFVRERIAPPRSGIPHRQFGSIDGAPWLWGRERIAAALDSEAGRRWEDAVLGMGLATMRRTREAVAHFGRLPAPGTTAAVTAGAPRPLASVLDRPELHEVRALVLMETGDIDGALAALGDALALDPASPTARLARARLRFDRGDVAGALEDTQTVIELFPNAEGPWRLRVELAERVGRVDLVQAGLEALTSRWPSDGVSWQKLGLLLQQQGRPAPAAEALERASLLAPSVDLRRP